LSKYIGAAPTAYQQTDQIDAYDELEALEVMDNTLGR